MAFWRDSRVSAAASAFSISPRSDLFILGASALAATPRNKIPQMMMARSGLNPRLRPYAGAYHYEVRQERKLEQVQQRLHV